MNTEQEYKIIMYQSVIDFLGSSLELLTPLPNFMNVYRSFMESVEEIQRITEQQSLNEQEVTKVKQELRQSLQMIAEEIAQKLHLLAQSTDDQLLLSDSWFSQTDPNKISDVKLVDRAMIIYELAERHIADLYHFGFYDDLLSEFKKTIDTFYALMPESVFITGHSKIADLQLADHFRNADEAIQFIDALINIIHLPESHFYSSYLKARRVFKSPAHPKELKRKVVTPKKRHSFREAPLH